MANHLQASVTLPHHSVFAAGVRDLGRKRDLRGNHLSVFAAGVRDLGRKRDLRGNHLSLFAAVPSNLNK
jgi:hypothetical protein